MKRLMSGVLLIALTVLVAAAWAEERRYEVKITLTEDQVKQVRGGSGRDVTVEFTADQLKAVQNVLPEFDFTEVTLTSDLLGRSNQILLILRASDDLRGRISMDPQPSP
jgi:hypothetical protein